LEKEFHLGTPNSFDHDFTVMKKYITSLASKCQTCQATLVTWIGLWCFISASSPIFYWATTELVLSMISHEDECEGIGK